MITDISEERRAKYSALLARPKAAEIAHTPETIRKMFLNGHKRSHNTYRAYKRALDQFGGFWASFERPLFELDKQDIEDVYLEVLFDNEASPQTISQQFTAIRGFYECAIEYSDSTGVLKNPARGVKLPTLAKHTHSKGLTVDQADRLERAARSLRIIWHEDPGTDGRNNVHALKATAVIKTLLTTGLRAGDLVSADIAGFDTSGDWGLLNVTRKGSVRDRVMVPPETTELLKDLVDGRDSGPLILSPTGRRETPAGIGDLLETVCGSGELDFRDRLYPHNLRVAFATFCYAAGVDELTIMTRMGHDKPETTRRYIVLASIIPKREARRILGL